MVRAVVTHGQIRPLEPLPSDWQEGQPLRIDRDESDTNADNINRDFTLLEQLCSTNDPKNERQIDDALQIAKRQAKEQVRRHMGLS